jgi:hypothetical protein
MLFGQRGKHDLVGLNLTYDEAQAFVKARMGKQVSSDTQPLWGAISGGGGQLIAEQVLSTLWLQCAPHTVDALQRISGHLSALLTAATWRLLGVCVGGGG